MKIRAYETPALARLRATSNWFFFAAFLGWLAAWGLAQAGMLAVGEVAVYLFLVGGVAGALAWLPYCVLVAPRLFRHVLARMRASRSGA